MKPIRFLREAVDDIEEAVEWYESRSSRLGRDLKDEISRLTDMIRDYPRSGAPYRNTSLRRLVTRRFPYVVYYLDHSDEIVIVAVAHGKRRPDYWMRNRLGLFPPLEE